ncbi:bacillithiol biosynthesis cysteine-adding enzyme BshC [Cytophagaceae bacterium 50C-KIRBA]|uniref:Putative cysteine ligase BshC n=1 Tax=Aquirufa beregesia TaxID=2516556 RepID=A0ABX0EWX2_9BACT|nr:bacillithiol biosynthesis cysteine-adding enzyme BshC [Aquirufa beregesia]NGZ43836.1 bacillithiol biosynthesis cysteine-adding enzyme BshC [Aquirufa beregesia]
MPIQSYPLSHLSAFSPLLLDYLDEKPNLKNLYQNSPNIAGFKNQLADKKSFPIGHRKALVEVLQDQYQGLENAPAFEKLLDSTTFTVTTGHQLNLMTGPLYVIYKIVSTINLAKQLKAEYPAYHFIPVYWMATEDHDWDEINHVHLNQKTYSWNTQQQGAVGRFTLEGISDFLHSLPYSLPIFQKAYSQSKTLTEAVRCYMHELFGAEGLICLDADDARLKSLFHPIMEADLLEHVHESLVESQNQHLNDLGYKTQINARGINLFYLQDGIRERIEKQGEYYHVLNQSIQFSLEELKNELQLHPERFSPNVVLRPLYQECILPNLAYLGGPAEVAYWLQLKGIFDHHRVPYPIVLPRNFALLLPSVEQKRIEKLGIKISDLFLPESSLIRKYVLENTLYSLDFQQEMEAVDPILEQMVWKAKQVDPTLEGSILAERQRWINGLERMAKKLKRAEERNHETAIRQIQQVKARLFPHGNWQERYDNLLDFYLDKPSLIQDLLDSFDPLHFELYVIPLQSPNA